MGESAVRMSRRASLGLLAGAAGVAASRPVATVDSYDLRIPKTRVEAYLRMRSRLDGKQTFMPYRATIFGKPEGKVAVPLFNVEGFSWTKATRTSDSSYRLDGVEAGYFLDLVTRQPLNRWTNPLNGLETTVKHYRTWAHSIVTTKGLEPIQEGPRPPGTLITANTGEPTVMNGKVWMHEDLFAQFPSRPKESFADPLQYFGPLLTATSLATWCADLADLANSAMSFVPTLLSYQTLGSWRPFMRMGSVPGLISWRMFGVKAPSLDGVPKHLRDRVLVDYPDFLSKETADTVKSPGT